MITRGFSEFIRSRTPITALTTDIKPYALDDDHADPAITYSLSNDRKINLLNGGTSALNVTYFEVLCWSDIYADAKELAAVVASEFRDYVGNFGSEYVAQKIEADLGPDVLDPMTGLRAASVSIAIWNNVQGA